MNLRDVLKTNDVYRADWNKLMKGKALRKHSLHEKTAASVLLKLLISSRYRTPLHKRKTY